LSESVLKFKQDLVSEFVENFDNVEQIDAHLLENTYLVERRLIFLQHAHRLKTTSG